MSPPRVAILSQQAPAYANALQDCLSDPPRCFVTTPAPAELAGIEVLLADPDLAAPLLDGLPALRWLQSTWAGVTPLLRRPARHYQLTNVRELFGPAMVEYVFAHLLALERQIEQHRQATAERRWQPLAPGYIRGKTLGLMGLGSIGRELAAAGRFFGLRVLGYSLGGRPLPTVERVYRGDELGLMLAESDYLVASLPSTLATRNLLDAGALARLKAGAVLINVGRGNLVDETALAAALQRGQLRAAVLDVLRQEPLPAAHPLWQAPNLLITSHTAAPSRVAEIAPLFADNYRRFCAGEPLRYQVDFTRGY